ncbi:MAG: hypothetical protein A2W35_14700 [Chloroflexi bacterium RBG_16_57_11]|nr:MAG: hypothetical protein A2W35_14700 [Chloroflexi bacterium RBG_16_57_11]
MLVRNPANSVVAPKPDRKPPETLTVGEVQQLFNEVKDHRYFPIYCIGVGCGLGEGEILGLRKKDVSLEKGIIKVEQTVVSIRGKILIGEPKDVVHLAGIGSRLRLAHHLRCVIPHRVGCASRTIF